MATSKVNKVTLFSNGIGHFRRQYDVSQNEPLAISIPFKKDHIGDVASSLQVFGNVQLVSPPSFTPNNSESTALEIDQRNALRSLLTNLSGAKVKVPDGTFSGEFTLVGVDVEESSSQLHNQIRSQEETFVVLSNGGQIVRKSIRHLQSGIEFVDDAVRAEIQKALNKNFQRIKPDSTFLDLELIGLKDNAEAQIQYTIPVAAWKMRYAVRQQGKTFTLEGAAIIDNNTDEDWRNFQISVVTGNPISFDTNIATVVEPVRRFVSVVDSNVLGHVEVEEGYDQESYPMAATAGMGGGAAPLRARSMKASVSNRADFGLEACTMDEAVGYHTTVGPAAQTPGMESKEVGDFCVFSAKEPITILARKSAVVPMFEEVLNNSGVVLYYKESKNPKRPYRTIKFKNETDYSLGRGKLSVYNEGVFSGECVLENTKPSENRVLPHCLENGLKVKKQTGSNEVRQSSIEIAEGAVISEEVISSQVTYYIENNKNEDFKVLLEHANQIGDSTHSFEGDVEISETEKVDDGVRVYFVVPANEKRKLVVKETYVRKSRFEIVQNERWLFNYIDIDNPVSELLEDSNVQSCIELRDAISKCNLQMSQYRDRVEKLEHQADRVRKNVEATKGSADNQVITDWVKELDVTNKEIVSIHDELIPALEAERQKLQQSLRDSLRKIAVKWTD